jgi:hypothetical protein
MNSTEDRLDQDLIELGAASVETRGAIGAVGELEAGYAAVGLADE